VNLNKTLQLVLFIVIVLAVVISTAWAVEITGIRHSVSSEKVRIVIEADGYLDCVVSEKFPDTIFSFQSASLKKSLVPYKILDGMFKDFYINSNGTSTNIFIQTSYPVKSKVLALTKPYRIVIDLPRNNDKAQQSINSDPSAVWKVSKPIADGLSYVRIKYPVSEFIAHALIVDPKKIDVSPAIAVPYIKKTEKSNNSFLGSVFGMFSDSDAPKERYSHFKKQRVSAYVKQNDAIAGINGSFFFNDGTPVGALVINDQIISSPLYNRTAFILYKNGSAQIDSVQMEGYLKLNNGETISFNGVNQPMSKDSIIVYTPDYQTTDPSNASVNFAVINDKVSAITYGETKIPNNGIVISASGSSADALKDVLKVSDEVKWFFLTTPPLVEISHVIAGGPRLVKDFKEYLTSDKERFKNDVAKSIAARTAVGITDNGYLILAVVEGVGKNNGATLAELAEMMIKLGAKDAMNLDGGGSSSMVVNNIKLNIGSERSVSNAIVLKKKEISIEAFAQ